MVRADFHKKGGRRLQAAARSALAGLALAGALAAPATAQPAPAAPAPAVQVAAPDSLTVAKLVWTTMAAVDHANQTGNYSVLRDLGAPSFQANNNAAALAGIFQGIRNQRMDLSNTLVVAPNYDFPPAIIEGGILRVKGTFPLRPMAIAFDLLFQPVSGHWALLGVSVAAIQGPAAPAPARR